jgi:transposase
VSLASTLRGAARSATEPVRGYFNGHFEMVKQEVRALRPPPGSGTTSDRDDLGSAREHVAVLQNTFAEASVHQARVLARLGDEVAELHERVADLERVVRQLAAVVAAERPDDAPGAG